MQSLREDEEQKKSKKKTTKQNKSCGAGVCRESSGPLSNGISAAVLERVYPWLEESRSHFFPCALIVPAMQDSMYVNTEASGGGTRAVSDTVKSGYRQNPE